jgi:hypothetical protein
LAFIELAQSSGSEQNRVSIALKRLPGAAFYDLWSGANGERLNQINSLLAAVERLKI